MLVLAKCMFRFDEQSTFSVYWMGCHRRLGLVIFDPPYAFVSAYEFRFFVVKSRQFDTMQRDEFIRDMVSIAELQAWTGVPLEILAPAYRHTLHTSYIGAMDIDLPELPENPAKYWESGGIRAFDASSGQYGQAVDVINGNLKPP